MQGRAREALQAAEEFCLGRLRDGFPSVAPVGRALFHAAHARALLAALGPRAPAPRSGLSAVQAAGRAIRILAGDRNKVSGVVEIPDRIGFDSGQPDFVCEAATVLFVAWLLSDAPAARAHPAAPFAPLFLPPRDAAAQAPTPAPGAPCPAGGAGVDTDVDASPGELAEILDTAARLGARWNETAAGAAAFVEGLALSVRAARAARARDRRAGSGPSSSPPRRPRDCALGLLFAALHTAGAPARAAPAPPPLPIAIGPDFDLDQIKGSSAPQPQTQPRPSPAAALLEAAEHCFGLYGDALGARIAREAARRVP
eukprot:tig00020746_g13669.t1